MVKRHVPRTAINGSLSCVLCVLALASPNGCGNGKKIPDDKPRVDVRADGTRTVSFTGWKGKVEDYRLVRDYDNIVELGMANADVTDETLAHLSGLTALRDLDLGKTAVTPKGLRQLTSLERLEILRLNNAPSIDDDIWEVIADLKSLTNVEVAGTKVTKEAAEKWKAADPKKRRFRL
jgi:hypothetical protein